MDEVTTRTGLGIMLAPALSFALLSIQIFQAKTVLERTKRRSLYRYISILAFVILTYAQQTLQKYLKANAMWGVILGATHCIYAVHLANLLLTETATIKSDLGHQCLGPEKQSRFEKNHSIAFRVCSSTRGIGTHWQVKNVPPVPRALSASTPQHATRVFLLRQSAIICWIYCWLRVIHIVWQQYIQGWSQRLFPLEEERALYSLVLERAAVRLFSGFFIWMGGLRASLELAYRIASGMCVVLGVSGPTEWPPLFGSVWDAYTLRRFWGKSWHQGLRWPNSAVSSYITDNILALPRPSLLRRYLHMSLVFLISGLQHLLGSVLMGAPCRSPGVLGFYCSFPLGILIEDCVQAVWAGRYQHTSGPNLRTLLWKRGVGFVWVMVWFSLTVPWYLYPILRLGADEITLFPLDLVCGLGLFSLCGVVVVGGICLWVFADASI